MIAEVFDFTISEVLCTSEVLLVEVDTGGSETTHNGTIVTLIPDNNTESASGFRYKAHIFTEDMDLDPGGGVVAPT